MISVSEGLEKLGPPYVAGEREMVQAFQKAIWHFFKK